MSIIISSEETDRLSGLPKVKYNTIKTLHLYNSKSHTCPTCHTNNNIIYHIPILNQNVFFTTVQLTRAFYCYSIDKESEGQRIKYFLFCSKARNNLLAAANTHSG